MKVQIIVDSASDLRNDYIKDKKIGFKVIPLCINVDQNEFIDDDNIDVKKELKAMHSFSGKSTTSCPSMGAFYDEFMKADMSFCVCITSKLSGTYNSAYQAASMAANEGKKVFVIDSKLVCGAEILLVDKLYELINQKLGFDDICGKISEYCSSLNLLFVLQKFDNFVKTGRISRLKGLFASLTFIKPLCTGENGEIKIVEKIRTAKGAFKRLVQMIGERVSNFKERRCIISHCQDSESANNLKQQIESTYDFMAVDVVEMKGLCSFYALEKGIIVCF